MKKEILAIPISLLLFLTSFSGCIEETSQIDNQLSIEKPKIVYVDDDYDNTISGWGYNYFNSVKDGINKVSEGGTVYVSDGIYYDNIVINKSINLIGNDKNTTIIDGGKKWDVLKITKDKCTIQNINISNSGSDAGLKILSNRTTLTNNILYGNLYGIFIESRFDNIISNNIFSNNKYDIKLRGTFNTRIIKNKILNNIENIILESSHNTTVSDNVLQNNGIKISGSFFSWKSHVIENNTANDKSIYYYKNENGVTVPTDATQVILANCSDFEIKNINFENIMIGIQIAFSSNIRIENNNFKSNNESAIQMFTTDNSTIISNSINGGTGIKLIKSENNRILQNTLENTDTSIEIVESNYNDISLNDIFSNSKYGLYLRSSSNFNEISKNNIYDNDVGFRVSSKHNNIFNNQFNNNSDKGLYICCSSQDNTIYKNSFLNNKKHIDYDSSRENLFIKDGFGNYWDDYLEKYPDATQINGIWDTPYEIPGSDYEDEYPLVEPVDI
ncbi:right-handed parallel beta-helix repeat-containing protein [Candidatus Woesearchaeota archaeon]|nr:right-handed parallel beta-helix repeat-containing protein [Candidatus Woesearchaeota archaeon]